MRRFTRVIAILGAIIVLGLIQAVRGDDLLDIFFLAVARNASALIPTDDNLASIVHGIAEEGRIALLLAISHKVVDSVDRTLAAACRGCPPV